jgi:hypothetical protein
LAISLAARHRRGVEGDKATLGVVLSIELIGTAA